MNVNSRKLNRISIPNRNPFPDMVAEGLHDIPTATAESLVQSAQVDVREQIRDVH